MGFKQEDWPFTILQPWGHQFIEFKEEIVTCVALYLDRTQVHTVETDFKLFLSEPHTALTLTTCYPLTKTLWFYDLHSQRQRGEKYQPNKRDAGFTPTFTLNSWSLSLSGASSSTSAITPGDLENKRKEERSQEARKCKVKWDRFGFFFFFFSAIVFAFMVAMKPREQLKQKSAALRQSETSRATSTEMQGPRAACDVLVKAVTH